MAREFWRIEKANTDLVGENTSLHERICGEFLFFGFIFLVCLYLMTNFHAGLSKLDGELLDAQTTSKTLQKDIEGEVLLTGRL